MKLNRPSSHGPIPPFLPILRPLLLLLAGPGPAVPFTASLRLLFAPRQAGPILAQFALAHLTVKPRTFYFFLLLFSVGRSRHWWTGFSGSPSQLASTFHLFGTCVSCEPFPSPFSFSFFFLADADPRTQTKENQGHEQRNGQGSSLPHAIAVLSSLSSPFIESSSLSSRQQLRKMAGLRGAQMEVAKVKEQSTEKSSRLE